MADRSIVIRLRAEIDEFRRRMNEASDAVSRNASHINTLANGAGLLGAAMTAAAGLAVKTAADFDQAMSAVQAATHESALGMDYLRDAALKAGKDTKFSASEAASGIEELAKAGVSTADILGGGLDGALALAAAGAIGVGDAAEIAATAMTQFKLGGDKVNHVADLLAAGAGKAQGGVGDLGAALKQAGLVANSTGLSIEETTAGLAAFASAGLIGSDAGTSFKSMLQRLTPQSEEAKQKMDELGISAYDSQGNFIGLSEFAGNLQDSLKNLTPEQRNAAEAVIFGSDAVRAANILYDQGAAGIDEWTAKVDDSGYAAETARIRMNNLKGDIEQLGGSIETALIETGDKAQGPLRSLVQAATGLVNAFTEAPAVVQAATLAIVGGGGLILLAGAGIAKLVVAINEAKVAIAALGISGKTAGLALGGIGLALAAATVGLTIWAQGEAKAVENTRALADSLDQASGAITKNTREQVKNQLSQGETALGFLKISDSAYDNAKKLGLSSELITDAAMGNVDAMEQVNAKLHQYDGNLEGASKAAREAGIDVAAYGTAQLQLEDQLKGTSNSLDEAIKIVKQKAEADDAATKATETHTEATKKQADTLSEAMQTAQSSLTDWRKAVDESDGSFVKLGDAYQGVIDKNKEMATAAADATKSTEDSWENFYDGVSVSAADYIASLQAQVDAQGRWEQNILDISKRVHDGLTGDMRTAAEQMIDELMQLGPEGAAQVQLLHDMSDEQFQQVVSLWQQKGTQAVSEFTSQVENYRQPVIDVTANTDPADTIVRAFMQQQRVMSIQVRATMPDLNGTVSGTGRPGFAGGGAAYGPGTSTSDSINARLSNGEHVFTASDVVKAGGQSAIYRLRSAIQAGALRFAQGGAVDFSTLHAQRFATGGGVSPAVGGSVSGGSVEVVGMVNRGTVYVVDPDAYARSVAARTRDTLYAQGVMR